MPNNRAFVFYDGNNLYHNLLETLKYYTNPLSRNYNSALQYVKTKDLDLFKLSEAICSHFGVKHEQSLYYNSVPSITDNPIVYTAHQNYLTWVASLTKFKVETRPLQRKSTRERLRDALSGLNGVAFCNSCKPLAENTCRSCIGSMDVKEKE